MNFSGILHNKLFLFGGGIIALLVLVRLLRGSNQAVISTTNGVAAPTDAQVQSQTALAVAQIDSANRASDRNFTLADHNMQYQETLEEKGIDAALAKYSIDRSNELSYRQIDAGLIAEERSQNLQASIAKWTLDQSYAMQSNNNAFQLAYAANANASADHQAEIIGAVTRASIDANTNLGIASLAAQTAQVASYVGGQVQTTESNNAANVAIVQSQSSAAKHSSTMAAIGSVVGGIAAIFSDRSLKRDIVAIGREPRDGFTRYSYRLIGDTSYQVGVMADEIPARMKGRIAGKETVRYLALA